jgi:S1-C subfamily serine protease
LLTGAGLIDAKVVQVDAANDLALLKADGKFSSLPIPHEPEQCPIAHPCH